MHVLDPVFFSGQAMVLEDLSHIRYRWSYLAKQVLHLKLHWNDNLVAKIICSSGTLGGVVPNTPYV